MKKERYYIQDGDRGYIQTPSNYDSHSKTFMVDEDDHTPDVCVGGHPVLMDATNKPYITGYNLKKVLGDKKYWEARDNGDIIAEKTNKKG